MKAEIKTVTTETVALELSIQEAHLLRAMLGGTPGDVAKEFGVSMDVLYNAWSGLRNLIGDAGPVLDVEVSK